MSISNKTYKNNRTGETIKVIDSFEDIAILENKGKEKVSNLLNPDMYTEQIDINSFFNTQGAYNILADKIKNITTLLKKRKIKKNIGWCDDPISNLYNKEIKLPSKFNHEKLYRNDSLYDLILVLNYNTRPVVKNKGSAIFIHIAKKKFAPTAGCIALKKKDLIKLLNNIKKNTKIKIH